MAKYNYCFLFCCMFVIACTPNVRKKKETATETYPDIIQLHYTHYIYKNGRVFLEAFIERGETFEKQKEIHCTEIQAKVYNAKNELTTQITANTAVINSRNSQFIFKEEVEVHKIDDKLKLTTEELRFDYKKNYMESSKEVLIAKDDGSTLHAMAFSSNLDDQTTSFTNMKMNYYYEEDEK